MGKFLATFVAFCGLAVGVIAADAVVTEMPKGAKVTKLEVNSKARTANSAFVINEVPEDLVGLQMVSVLRGKGNEPAPEYTFVVDKAVTIYLLVQDRGTVTTLEGWEKIEGKVKWAVVKNPFTDSIYTKDFDAGTVTIPAHNGIQGNNYGIPNAAVIKVK